MRATPSQAGPRPGSAQSVQDVRDPSSSSQVCIAAGHSTSRFESRDISRAAQQQPSLHSGSAQHESVREPGHCVSRAAAVRYGSVVLEVRTVPHESAREQGHLESRAAAVESAQWNSTDSSQVRVSRARGTDRAAADTRQLRAARRQVQVCSLHEKLSTRTRSPPDSRKP